MGLLSQLNCFSSKKKGRGRKGKTLYDDDDGGNHQQLLLPSGSGSNSTSPTRRTGASSDASGGSCYDPQHHDDISLPTVDPDYNHVQASNFSVSDVDGTVGSQNQSLADFSHAASAFGSMAPSRLGDGSSMTGAERRMYASHLIGSPQGPPRKAEETVEVRAPRGKLGLVIDTPAGSSTPVVHAIKDTCPIRSQIFVGDKLVAVDEVDVREMTAQEVSRLIGRRVDQEVRKLTRIRGASFGGVGSGMY